MFEPAEFLTDVAREDIPLIVPALVVILFRNRLRGEPEMDFCVSTICGREIRGRISLELKTLHVWVSGSLFPALRMYTGTFTTFVGLRRTLTSSFKHAFDVIQQDEPRRKKSLTQLDHCSRTERQINLLTTTSLIQ